MTPLACAHVVWAHQSIDIDFDLIDELVKHKQKGDRLMFLRTHSGQIRIKIKYGPLKCRVKRFITNNETFEQIKQKISLKN